MPPCEPFLAIGALFLLHAVALAILVAMAKYDVLLVDDQERPMRRGPRWQEQVVHVKEPIPQRWGDRWS